MADEATPDYALLDRAGAAAQAFYPRPDRTPAPPGAEDLAIEVEPGVAVAARFYEFESALPTILYFHGNGEVASDHDEIAPLYGQAGANLFVAEFRGYGRSGGRPTFANLVTDAHAIDAHFHALLDERGFSARRLVMGRSLGTHAALELAANAGERFSGLVVESGAANLRRLIARLGAGGGAEATALIEAHEAKIRSIRLPVLIIHGELDELVPLEHAAELYELLGGTERALVVIPNAGHNDLLWRGLRQYFEAIASFLARNGGSPPA